MSLLRHHPAAAVFIDYYCHPFCRRLKSAAESIVVYRLPGIDVGIYDADSRHCGLHAVGRTRLTLLEHCRDWPAIKGYLTDACLTARNDFRLLLDKCRVEYRN